MEAAKANSARLAECGARESAKIRLREADRPLSNHTDNMKHRHLVYRCDPVIYNARMMKVKVHSIFLGYSAFFALVACGPEERPEVERPGEPEPDAVASAAVVEENGVFVVEITTDDTMRFREEQFEIPAGGEVRLVLNHVGNLPAQAMGHNVVILQQGVDQTEFAMAAARAAATNYVPEDREDDVIAYTEVIGGGESTEITFTAPEDAGEYIFICSFPGHTAAGMTGVMVVR